MRITEVRIDGFRNLSKVDLSPGAGVNILFGENAQGKTNLLEAVWLASGEKSFRGAKEREEIGFDSENAQISVDFESSERTQNISLTISRRRGERKILLNGVRLRSYSELTGKLLLVIFTPEDLWLTRGTPEIRRDYIDLCIAQIRPVYKRLVLKYEGILEQRNTLLKNIVLGISKRDELEIWDEQLARQGSYISMMRGIYTKLLEAEASRLYSQISRGLERLELEYSSTVFESLERRTDYKGEMAAEYLEKLRLSRPEDIRLGYTQIGIHRDDILVKINGVLLRDYGSQGQNRSAALCMKLAQARALLAETGEMPVILLDDVLSELDRHRREFVVRQIGDAQIFITCCEPFIKTSGRVFKISGGKVMEKEKRKDG